MKGSLPPKVTVRYAGDVRDARSSDGKIWFAVDGQAVLTRELRQRSISQQQLATPEAQVTSVDVTVSLHVALGASSTPSSGDWADPAAEGGDSPGTAASKHPSLLLLRAAQANPALAAATALPAGVHILCHQPYPRDDGAAAAAAAAAAGKPAVSASTPPAGKLAALWESAWSGTGPAEEAERLTWQAPCLDLLSVAGSSLGSQAFLSIARSTPLQGWALVPCSTSENLVCALARGAGAGGGGKVAWLHLAMDATEAAAFGAALVDRLLVTSDDKPEPTYASVSARKLGSSEVEVRAEAHRVLSGALSGYHLGLGPPAVQPGGNRPSDERTDEGEPSADGALFVDDSTADASQGWRGAVSSEELPGGGLHRHVRVRVDASCGGEACDGLSGAKHAQANEWCELLLAQHVPQGAYIDVDEVKARHDFNVISSLPAGPRVAVETFEGQPIDVELPSSVSGQHIVNFSLRMDVSERHRGREGGGEASFRAEVTLPVHLRYPDPACERREGQDCEEYAWVQIPPPLTSIRCGSAGDAGAFSPVLPLTPPVGVALRVPRGIVWHRDVVVWGTVTAAAVGCLYTVYTLWSVMAAAAARDLSRKHR